MAAAPPSFPLKTANFEADVGGQPAAFSLTAYADRLLVVVSCVGTLGTILQAARDAVLGGGTTYRVETLLGRRDDPVPELCARQLAERLAQEGCDHPLLLCLGAPGLDAEGVRDILRHVLEHPVWQ